MRWPATLALIVGVFAASCALTAWLAGSSVERLPPRLTAGAETAARPVSHSSTQAALAGRPWVSDEDQAALWQFVDLCLDTDGDPAQVRKLALATGYSTETKDPRPGEWVAYFRRPLHITTGYVNFPADRGLRARVSRVCRLEFTAFDHRTVVRWLAAHLGVQPLVPEDGRGVAFLYALEEKPRRIDGRDTRSLDAALAAGTFRTIIAQGPKDAPNNLAITFSREKAAQLDRNGRPLLEGETDWFDLRTLKPVVLGPVRD